MLPILTALVGIIVSLIIIPIFVDRYMVMVVPCLWFALTVLVCKSKNYNITLLFILFVISISFQNTTQFTVNEISYIKTNEKFEEFFGATKDTVYICESGHTAEVLEYKVDNEICKKDSKDISKYLKEGKAIYLVDFHRESIKGEIENLYKCTCDFVGDYRIEYQTKIYKLIK